MCCREGAISALSPRPQSYFEGGLLFKPCCSLIFTGTGEAGGCVCEGKAFLPLCKCWERRHGRHAGSSPAPTQGWHPALAPELIKLHFFNQHTKKIINEKSNSWLNPSSTLNISRFSPPSPPAQRESKAGGRCSTTFLLNVPKQTGEGELAEPSPRALRKANRNRSFHTPKNLAFQSFCYSFLPLIHFTLQEMLAGRNVSLAVIPCRKTLKTRGRVVLFLYSRHRDLATDKALKIKERTKLYSWIHIYSLPSIEFNE